MMKKSILLVTSGFPYGESERSFLGTEFDILAKRFKVCVLACDAAEKILYPVPETVSVYPFRYREPDLKTIPGQLKYPEVRSEWKAILKSQGSPREKLHRAIETAAYWSAQAEEIRETMENIVQEHSISVVYTYWCLPATVAALRLKEKYPQLRVITRFHGFDLYQERNLHGWQPLRSYVAQNCDSLIFISKKGKEYFNQHWGGAEKSTVAYLGSRAMEKRPLPDSPVLTILSCSRTIPLKRLDLLIEVLALLPEESRVRWIHLGDGEEQERLRRLAADQLDRRPNVEWLLPGAVPNEQLPELYQKYQPQLFVTTSSTEGLPVSIMEAFAQGIPALATAVGGIPELVREGETGLLLPENPTAQQVADRIVEYARLPLAQKQRLGDGAYGLWQAEFNAAANGEKMAELLAQL